MDTARILRPLSALALVGVLSACGSAGSGAGEATSAPASSAPSATRSVSISTGEASADATGQASPSEAAATETAEPTPSATSTEAGIASGEPTPGSTGEGQEVALTRTFTTPDGTISFDYPADWSVTASDTSTAEIPLWNVVDANGVRVFTLSIRPDGQIASPATPQNPATVATLPDALDARGQPLVVGVGPFPGQAPGVAMSNVYAVTSGTGADRIFGYVSRGDGTMVSFEGTQEGGINDQVDMADETQKFLQSSRFTNEILPVLRSFTMKPAAG